jgi:ABC-2 type transport system ATP-binding protein
MPILTVNNLAKTFTSGFWPFSSLSSYTAVNNVSFQLNEGEILGLLGPNGAGKTTTIQMLLGTLTPTEGTIRYFGKDLTHHRIEIFKKVGYASGYDRLPGQLTILENLHIIGRVYGMTKAERDQQIERLLKSFYMWDMRNKQISSLSAGQTTCVMLAKAFMGNPQIVLLDEPTASLDPDIASQVCRFIVEQRKECNTSFLITSHNMYEVTEICDRVLVFKSGVIIADNSPDELAQSIAKVTLCLRFVESELQKAVNYVQSVQVNYKVQMHEFFITIDEHMIAQFLADLGKHGISYSHISIDKPTLKDYFLSVTKGKRSI